MNKILFIFLIVFFVAAIVIGLNAIFEDVRPNSQASNACPPQRFPENTTCPQSMRIELVKNPNGCYEFACN